MDSVNKETDNNRVSLFFFFLFLVRGIFLYFLSFFLYTLGREVEESE